MSELIALLVRTLSSKEQVALTDLANPKGSRGRRCFSRYLRPVYGRRENDAENASVFADTLFRLLSGGARTITGAHHAPKGF